MNTKKPWNDEAERQLMLQKIRERRRAGLTISKAAKGAIEHLKQTRAAQATTSQP